VARDKTKLALVIGYGAISGSGRWDAMYIGYLGVLFWDNFDVFIISCVTFVSAIDM
jgi:hypothetical protein